MNEGSSTKTLSVPAVGLAEATRVIQAPTDRWMRVLVRNTGGNLIFVAYEQASLTSVATIGDTYSLPAGQSDVFVLAPCQALFMGGNGGCGQASIAVSMAIQISSFMES